MSWIFYDNFALEVDCREHSAKDYNTSFFKCYSDVSYIMTNGKTQVQNKKGNIHLMWYFCKSLLTSQYIGFLSSILHIMYTIIDITTAL